MGCKEAERKTWKSHAEFCLNQETLQRPLGFIGKLPEHHTQSPVCKFLMSTVWSSMGVMLNEFAYEFYRSVKILLVETKGRTRLATNISQVFDNSLPFV